MTGDEGNEKDEKMEQKKEAASRSSPRLHRDLDAMSTRCIERDWTARENSRCSTGDGLRRDAMQIRASMVPFPLPPPLAARTTVSSLLPRSDTSGRVCHAIKCIFLMNIGYPEITSIVFRGNAGYSFYVL